MKQFVKLVAVSLLLFATIVFQSWPASADTMAGAGLTDVAAQANITSLQVTGAPDTVFAALERKYRPARNSLSNPVKWAGFLRQGGRSITLQLGKQTYVSSVTLSFELNKQAGMTWPNSMQVLTSPDAHNWYLLNSGNYSITKTGNIETFTISSSMPVTASLIKINFPVVNWAFAGQLHIWASPTPGSSQQPSPIVVPGNSVPNIGYLPSTSLGNARHILLVYTGANGNLGHWSVQDYLPMLNYYNQSGSATSTMFDTMLFLPYSNAQGTATGWQNYLNDLFAPNGEIANLETATELAGQQMGESRRITNVILSIPYASPTQTNFGAITPGGTSLNLDPTYKNLGETQSLQNREAATSWYMKQLMADWNQSSHPDLNLVATYWDEESITAGSDDPTVVQFTHQLTAAAHLPLLWIPFYGADGVNDWNKLGFDAAILQSNYYETPTATTARIVQTAQAANQYGLGIELEVQAGALTSPDQLQRYTTELNTFSMQMPPYNNTVEAFYDGSKVLLDAYQSSSALAHSLYDTTGLWLQSH